MNLTLSSNAAAIRAQLSAFPPEMLARIAKAIDLQNELSIGVIQKTRLSRRGPDTLGVRTNRLRSSISRAPATVLPNGSGVVSAIGSNVKYAGAHEYGFAGTVEVRAHTRRRVITHTTSVAATFNPLSGKIDKAKKTKRRVDTGETIQVRAHGMKMRIPQRAYIRTVLAQRAGEYSTAVSEAIVAAWKGGRA